MLLACMRMTCDTPAILDASCRISPKLEELEGILTDLLGEPDRKIIIFSECWSWYASWRRSLAWKRLGIPARCRSGAAAPRSCAAPDSASARS